MPEASTAYDVEERTRDGSRRSAAASRRARRRLSDAGLEASIHVIGGSAMALNFPDGEETRVTRDIDAIVHPTAEVKKIVELRADDHGLSPTWLNSNGAPFVPPRPHRNGTRPGVVVTTATTRELIAMKLAAAREQDLFDLGILARHAGITDASKIVDIAFEAYGEDSVVLNEPRADYLILAEQALRRAPYGRR